MNEPSSARSVHSFILALSLGVLSPGEGKAEVPLTPEGPRSGSFTHPLRSDAVFASGEAAPWMSAPRAWVSADGKQVAFFARESPSDEGFSRTWVVKDVDTDAIVLAETLFSKEESLHEDGAWEHLARDRAHRLWATRPQEQWIPLAHRDLSDHEREFFSDACFERQLHPKRSATLESLTVTYREPRVQVWHRGKKLLDRQVAGWRLKQDSCPSASPSWLSRVFGDATRGVLLLELDFCGSDLCPEPATAFHVLRIQTP